MIASCQLYGKFKMGKFYERLALEKYVETFFSKTIVVFRFLSFNEKIMSFEQMCEM